MRRSLLVIVGGVALAVSAVLVDCLSPTELTLTLTTNLDCAKVRGFGTRVVVTVDGVSEPPVTTTACDVATGRIGTIVLTPSQRRGAALRVEVTAGTTRDPSQCAPGSLDGCVVARRSLAYIEHTPLYLPIALDRACVSVECSADETCVLGVCKSAVVVDAHRCADPSGCGESTLTGGDGGPDGAADAAPDVQVLDASAPDALACPSLAGPTMVRVLDAGFCIDSTEVTSEHYGRFLEAGVDAAGASCSAWKSKPGFEPDRAQAGPTYPVVGIDWCDAYSYCAWAGKRLCGRMGGGRLTGQDASASQAYQACSRGGVQAFPYGNGFAPGACNSVSGGSGALEPIKSRAGCQGGVPGVFDMSGNAEEWQDWCDVDDAGVATCHELAGSFLWNANNAIPSARCDVLDDDSPQNTFPDMTIRCCSP